MLILKGYIFFEASLLFVQTLTTQLKGDLNVSKLSEGELISDLISDLILAEQSIGWHDSTWAIYWVS